jgi:signal transduction histidine kinase
LIEKPTVNVLFGLYRGLWLRPPTQHIGLFDLQMRPRRRAAAAHVYWEVTDLQNRFLGIATIVLTTLVALKAQAAHLALQRAEFERAANMAMLAELAASVVYEVRHPLTGVVANADACLRWLDNRSPDLNEVRQAARDIIKDANRTNELVGSVIRRVILTFCAEGSASKTAP